MFPNSSHLMKRRNSAQSVLLSHVSFINRRISPQSFFDTFINIIFLIFIIEEPLADVAVMG